MTEGHPTRTPFRSLENARGSADRRDLSIRFRGGLAMLSIMQAMSDSCFRAERSPLASHVPAALPCNRHRLQSPPDRQCRIPMHAIDARRKMLKTPFCSLLASCISPFHFPVPSPPPNESCAAHSVPSSPTRSRTSSPGLNAGSPTYGQPSQRNASPSAQLPQLPALPGTVKSVAPSSRSAALSLARPGAVPLDAVDLAAPVVGLGAAPVGSAASAASARVRVAASSAARRAARPQVQSLQARRRLPGLGVHSGAAEGVSV